MHLLSTPPVELIVVGGGPAGFMAAITAAELGVKSVQVLESTSKPLEKVRLSGGGRCNVTNACSDIRDLVTNYPRGSRPLLSPFSRFATKDVFEWFTARGVDLVEESDGRIFPASNTSSTVVECLKSCAKKAGVLIQTKKLVTSLKSLGSDGFLLSCKDSDSFVAKKVLLSTGGHPIGRKLALEIGHSIVKPVPSLFSFTLDTSFFKECSGIALKDIGLKLYIDKKKYHQSGPLLITHWGFSGPAILKLSAFAARDLYSNKYFARLLVNWSGMNLEKLKSLISLFRLEKAKNTLASAALLPQLPKRLWLALLKQVEISGSTRWAEFSNQYEKKLIHILASSSYNVIGRGPFGEEFVTAGGVNLSEINFSTMESLLCPGLYFAGEVLDIDGVTGGFNFQHCWTSGWIVGKAIAN